MKNKKFALYTRHNAATPTRPLFSSRVLINLKLVLVAWQESNSRQLSLPFNEIPKIGQKQKPLTEEPSGEGTEKTHRHIKQKSFFKRCTDCYFYFPRAGKLCKHIQKNWFGKRTFNSLCHTFVQDIYKVCFEVFAFQLAIRLKRTRIHVFIRQRVHKVDTSEMYSDSCRDIES